MVFAISKDVMNIFLAILLLFCAFNDFAHAEISKEKMMQETTSASDSSYLIDDFSQKNVSAIGNRWQSFSDQVMGGVSKGGHAFEVIEGRNCIRLSGNVSLENQGGFIQVALPLEQDRRPFDASRYEGLRISVLGNGETYYIHLRTRQTRLPWQYYQAPFETTGQWSVVEIPFNRFVPENLRNALDPARLTRVAIVAAKKAYKADVAVAHIELYRTKS
jgi:hypothetical protein